MPAAVNPFEIEFEISRGIHEYNFFVTPVAISKGIRGSESSENSGSIVFLSNAASKAKKMEKTAVTPWM